MKLAPEQHEPAAHQGAVVTTDGFDAFAVHLVVFLRPGEVEAGVTLLVDQQVGMINLLELELDGLDELLRDEVGRLLPELHRFDDSPDAKLDHDGIGVAVDDLGVELVAVVDGVPLLYLVLGELNHLPAEGRDTLRDLQTGQLSDLSSGEAVHRVGADLQGQLTTVKNLKTNLTIATTDSLNFYNSISLSLMMFYRRRNCLRCFTGLEL